LSLSFILGQALMQRGNDEDINRAAAVLSTANLNGVPRHLAEPVMIATVQALTKLQRIAEADEYMRRYGPIVTPSLVLAAKAHLALKGKHPVSADRLLTDSVAALAPDENEAVLDFLVRNLMQVGRLKDALPLLQALFGFQFPNFDAGLLLDCASRLQRDDVVLKTCQALFERGQRDWNILEFELQYLEDYDFGKAVARLETFIADHPDQRVAKLRLAILTSRVTGRSTIKLDEESLPLPDELPTRYAVAAVEALQANNQAMVAVDYAYRVLRSHFSDLNAHSAFVNSLNPAVRPEDIPIEMERVAIGSAVLYSEGASVPMSWFVIEDTPAPSAEFEEISANSPIAQDLLGKTVGETFVLAKSTIKNRVGIIHKILSKYTRRFQACMSGMQILFGDASPIESVEMGSSGTVTHEDIEPILDSVKQQAEEVNSLRQAYANLPISLHTYGARFGRDAYDALVDLAASDLEIRCADARPEAFQQAIGTLQSKSTVIIELSALATIRLLGIEKHVLRTEGIRFAISQATAEKLEQIRIESRKGASGSMVFQGGQHYLVTRTAEEAEEFRGATEEWIDLVKANVSLLSAPRVAELDPERRKELDGMLGRYGLEAASLAQSPGHILWTDDLVLGVIASHELGVERIWTQAFLEYLVTSGTITREAADVASARLVGYNFVATHFNSRTILSAFRTANWALDNFPARQMISGFRQACSNAPAVSFRIFAEFALLIFAEPLLPETRCLALKSLLDAFPEDALTSKRLRKLLVQIAKVLEADPAIKSAFVKCYELWERGKLIIP
jgi:hypothetical protein